MTHLSILAALDSSDAVLPLFPPNSGLSGQSGSAVYALALGGEKLIIGGDFDAINSKAHPYLSALNTSDGSVDDSFNPKIEAPAGNFVFPGVYTIAIAADGKILIGGQFEKVNGIARKSLARLNNDGALDTSFDPGSGTDDTVAAVAIQTDGKIVIGGFFKQFNGQAAPHLARLNANGQVDDTFQVGSGPDGPVDALVLQSDGNVLVGGNFSNFNGLNRGGIARVFGGSGSPAVGQALFGPKWEQSRFSVSVIATAHQRYTLEHKDSLADLNWTALAPIQGVDGVLTLTDTAATAQNRFYRVRLE